MLKIANHPRDANQNDNEAPSHTYQNGYYQQINKQMTSTGKDVEQKEPSSYTAGENADWCSHCEKTV